MIRLQLLMEQFVDITVYIRGKRGLIEGVSSYPGQGFPSKGTKRQVSVKSTESHRQLVKWILILRWRISGE